MTPPITSPLPLPEGARRVLLVGGTFDPPHEAHASMALAARAALDDARRVPPVAARSDRREAQATDGTSEDTGCAEPRPVAHAEPTAILFVPTARSPFKPAPMAPDALRVEMLSALAATIPAAGVWTDELDRAPTSPNTPSYWVDTLGRAHAAIIAQYLHDPGHTAQTSRHARHAGEPLPSLHFMIGVDQAVALHRWRDARRILELASPVIVLRPPMADAAQLASALREAAFWGEGEIDDLVSRVVSAPLSDVSASSIRSQLATSDVGSATGLPAGVREILQRANPYRRSN